MNNPFREEHLTDERKLQTHLEFKQKYSQLFYRTNNKEYGRDKSLSTLNVM
jgi:hypothetical protein